MGNSHKIIQEDESSSQIMKKKEQIQFLQTTFVRQVVGSIQNHYQILSPAIISNQYYQLRKTIHLRTKLIRSVFIINKYKVRTQQRQLLQKQINGLKGSDSPHLLKIYELYLDKHRFYITCQYCKGLSLSKILQQEGSICQRKAALIMKQLLSTLGQCHRLGICHSDLKLQNIMFNSQKQQVIKITDFSISRIFRINDIIHQSKKKAFLAAPQLLSSQPTSKSDIWSCGMILYIMITGQPPITGSFAKKLKQKFIFYEVSFNHPKFRYVSKQLKTLISEMLKYSQDERPTAQECLRHPWLQKFYKGPSICQALIKSTLLQCFNFHPLSKLQEAVWNFYVNSLISFEQKQLILHIYQLLDEDSKGNLNQEDLKKGFMKFAPQKQANFYATFIYRRHKWKPIQFTEFLVSCTNRNFLINSENTRKIFKVFDDDDSGQISMSELKNILGSSKEVSPQIWYELMKEADSNSDGEISFEEFQMMIEDLKNKNNSSLLSTLNLKNLKRMNDNFIN